MITMTVTCQLTVLSNGNRIAKKLLELGDIIANVTVVNESIMRDTLKIELKQELEHDELIMLGALIGRIDSNNV
jgi:hypothetical protein